MSEKRAPQKTREKWIYKRKRIYEEKLKEDGRSDQNALHDPFWSNLIS